MRIISGKYKGRKIYEPVDKNTRPLKDLVKESIFNLIIHSKKIQINIEKAIVLDLFSGSGSFGLECASRNAREVLFFENHPNAIKTLKKNIETLKDFFSYKIFETDCFEYFSSEKSFDKKFNLIFVDPPYKEKKINNLLNNIIEKNILNDKGIVVLHRHKKDEIALTNKLKIFEERVYGISKIIFCEKN